MSSIISDSTYKKIQETPSLGALLGRKAAIWRDENANAARKITCGLALLAGSLIGLIDAVASLALAILTAPAEFAGIELGRSFLMRAIASVAISFYIIPLAMYYNISKDSVDDPIQTNMQAINQ